MRLYVVGSCALLLRLVSVEGFIGRFRPARLRPSQATQWPSPVAEVVQDPVFKEVSQAFRSLDEMGLREMTREDVVDAFRGNSTLVLLGLSLMHRVQALLEPPKVIWLHTTSLDDPDANWTSPLKVKLSSASDFERTLRHHGAMGLSLQEAPESPIMNVNEIVNGAHYWLSTGCSSEIESLQIKAVQSQGWRDKSAAFWEWKVKQAIPGLFKPENLTLAPINYKFTDTEPRRQIDGLFFDHNRGVVVLVESKSGATQLSEKSGEELAAMSPEEIKAFARKAKSCADAQIMATMQAIRSSKGDLKQYADMEIIMVIGSHYLDEVNEDRAAKKLELFRFVRPDGSGLALYPSRGL